MKRNLPAITICIGFVALGAALYSIAQPANHITPINKHWRTYVYVEQYRAVNESKPQTTNANESELPFDAYNVEYRIEATCNSDRLVVDGTPAPLVVNCQKRTIAYYAVDRWVFDRVLEITGNEHEDIRYPALVPYRGQCLDCYHELERRAQYFVDFLYRGEIVTYQARDKNEWESIGIEMPYTVQLDTAQGIDWATLQNDVLSNP